jgi:hypothetical protein
LQAEVGKARVEGVGVDLDRLGASRWPLGRRLRRGEGLLAEAAAGVAGPLGGRLALAAALWAGVDRDLALALLVWRLD